LAVLLFAAGADFVLLAALRLPVARVFAALLRLLAVVLPEAMVFAAWDLLEAVGFFAVDAAVVVFFVAVLLFAAGADFVLLPLAKVLAALLFAEALVLFFARVLAAPLLLALLAVPVDLLVGIYVSLLAIFAYSTKALIVWAMLKIISTFPVEKYCKKPKDVLKCSCDDEREELKCRG